MMFVVLGTFFHQLHGKLTISKVKFKFKLKYLIKEIEPDCFSTYKKEHFQ